MITGFVSWRLVSVTDSRGPAAGAAPTSLGRSNAAARSCQRPACQARYSASKSPAAFPSPRGRARCPPCASSCASRSVGTAWYVAAHSVLPHPKTVYVTPPAAPAAALLIHLQNWAALSGGVPLYEEQTIRTAPSAGRSSM